MGKVWAVADDLGPRRAFIKMEEEGNELATAGYGSCSALHKHGWGAGG